MSPLIVFVPQANVADFPCHIVRFGRRECHEVLPYGWKLGIAIASSESLPGMISVFQSDQSFALCSVSFISSFSIYDWSTIFFGLSNVFQAYFFLSVWESVHGNEADRIDKAKSSLFNRHHG